MSEPVSYRIVEDGGVVLSKDAKFPKLRGSDKSVLKPDLQVKIGQRVWGVNSCVLRVYSKMVDDMLDSIVVESGSSEIPVDSSCVQPNVFDQILNLIYDGEVVVQAGDIFALHAASDFLEYTELAEACIAFLRDHLDVNLLAKAWKYSNSHSQAAASVVQICQQKIPDVFEAWSKVDDFCLLTFEELSSVMEIAKLRIKNRNENIIFEAIVRWLYSDWSGRCRYINAMLATVYWKRLDTGKAINCDTVRAICQADVRSLEEREAMIMLLRAIGMGPAGDFEKLFGVKVSEPPDHVVAGIATIMNGYDCDIVVSTLDNNTHSEVKKETVKIPPEMRVEGMKSRDMCSFDSRLYVLKEVDRASVYVLYEYDRKSGVFQYAVLRPPPGRGTFDSPQCTRVFLDGARVFIANADIEDNGLVVYYMARAELVFSQNPLVNVDEVASCQLLAAVAHVPDYSRELSDSTLAFDDVAGRLYCCCGWLNAGGLSNRVFYMDLQSKAFVRCPDYPLKLLGVDATVHEGSLLVAGGQMENTESSPKVWRLDKDGTDWVELPSMNMGHCNGSLLVKDGRLYHFDTFSDELVGLETLDLMSPQDGWKMNENSKGMFMSMRKFVRFYHEYY